MLALDYYARYQVCVCEGKYIYNDCRDSYAGACQLELDVLYVRTWLASDVSDPALSLLNTDALACMDAGVLLLKQQPPSVTCQTINPQPRRQC